MFDVLSYVDGKKGLTKVELIGVGGCVCDISFRFLNIYNVSTNILIE